MQVWDSRQNLSKKRLEAAISQLISMAAIISIARAGGRCSRDVWQMGTLRWRTLCASLNRDAWGNLELIRNEIYIARIYHEEPRYLVSVPFFEVTEELSDTYFEINLE